MPSRLGLGDGPAGQLLDTVAAAGPGAGITGAGRSALAVRDRMLEVGLAGGTGTRRPGALVVADLDQAAQPVARQVGADPIAVVAQSPGGAPERGCAASQPIPASISIKLIV